MFKNYNQLLIELNLCQLFQLYILDTGASNSLFIFLIKNRKPICSTYACNQVGFVIVFQHDVVFFPLIYFEYFYSPQKKGNLFGRVHGDLGDLDGILSAVP